MSYRPSPASPLNRAGATFLAIAGVAAAVLAVLSWTDLWRDARALSGVFGVFVPLALKWTLSEGIFYAISTAFAVVTVVLAAILLVRGVGRSALVVFGVIGSAYFIFALIYLFTNTEYDRATVELYVAPVVSLLLWLVGTICLIVSPNRGTSWR